MSLDCETVRYCGPGMSADDMARACGLKFAFRALECSLCGETRRFERCYVALSDGVMGTIALKVCETCLPAHFVKHMREQSALDAIVEEQPHDFELADALWEAGA